MTGSLRGSKGALGSCMRISGRFISFPHKIRVTSMKLCEVSVNVKTPLKSTGISIKFHGMPETVVKYSESFRNPTNALQYPLKLNSMKPLYNLLRTPVKPIQNSPRNTLETLWSSLNYPETSLRLNPLKSPETHLKLQKSLWNAPGTPYYAS